MTSTQSVVAEHAPIASKTPGLSPQFMAMLRTAYEALSSIAIVYDFEAKIVYANSAAIRMLGWGSDTELEQYRSRMEIFDRLGDPLACENWPLFRALRGEDVTDHELIIAHPSLAHRVHCRLSARITDFEGLSPAPLIVVSGHDVTDEVRAIQKIVEGHRLLEIVTQSADIGLAIVGEDMSFRFANRKFAAALSKRPSQLVGQAICPEESAGVAAMASAVRAGLTRRHVVRESRWPDADGGERWFRIAVNPQDDEDQGKLAVIVMEDITQRKLDELEIRRSEAEARANESRLMAVMDALPTAVAIADRDGAFQRVNAAFYAICGPSPDATGVDDYAAFEGTFPDGRPLHAKDWPLARAILHGETVTNERIDLRRSDDGQVRHLSISAAPFRGADGGLLGGVVAAEDLTGLIEAIGDVHAKEEQLRLLIDGTRDHAVFMLDEAGKVVTWGGGAQRLKRYEPQEVIGRDWAMFFAPDDAAAGLPASLLITARRDGVAYHQGWRYRSDGSRFWSDAVISAIEREGRIVGFTEVARDLTDERFAQAELRLRDSAMRAVSQGILVTEARGDYPIILASGGFAQVTGYAPEEAIGRNCRFLQGPETDPATLEVIRTALAAGRDCSVELVNYRKDGTRFWNALYLSPILDDAGEVEKYIGVMADVTQRRDLESRLRDARKMDALGRLAGGIAHDFNNVLTVINGNAEDLIYSAAADDPARDQLELILGAGTRAEMLTRQLLTFSRREVSSASIVQIAPLLSGMEQLLRSLVGDSADLMLKVEPDLWPATGEPGQIEQVVMNLVINARDALCGRGLITVQVRNVQLEAAGEVGDLPAGDFVRMTVSDTGCGMSEDVIVRAFEPFFTTKGVKGSGLGLATVFGIVSHFGGDVSIRSIVGLGSSIVIHLPRATIDMVRAADDYPRRTTLQPGARILLVEDEDEVRRYVRRTLERLGHDVIEARSGDEAIEIERTIDGRIDILVSDIVMPGMSGLAVASAIRKARPDTRIVLMSGYTEDALDPESHDAFLQKPPSTQAIAAALQ